MYYIRISTVVLLLLYIRGVVAIELKVHLKRGEMAAVVSADTCRYCRYPTILSSQFSSLLISYSGSATIEV